MGQSLTVCVFWGVVLPSEEFGGPRRRLTKAARIACGCDEDYEGADLYELTRRHPACKSLIDSPLSGVGDYVTRHVAICESMKTAYDGDAIALADMDLCCVVPSRWHETLFNTLACLEWYEINYEGDEEVERVVPAPELQIGWHVVGCWF